MNKEFLIQRIYDAPINRASKSMIDYVLEGIEAAGLVIVDPSEVWPGTKIPRALFPGKQKRKES